MSQIWQFQSNIRDRGVYSTALADACQKLLLPWAAFPLRPFDETFPVIEWDGPRVFYGSTSWVKRAKSVVSARDPYWFDEKTFRPSVWGKALRDQWANGDASFLMLGELLDSLPKGPVFVRPDSDLKAFVGQVVDPEDLQKRFAEWSLGWSTFDSTLQIIVSSPKTILNEVRLWVVEDRPIAGAYYKVDGKSAQVALPEERLETGPLAKSARECIRRLDGVLAPVYVLDMTEVDGKWEAVEINTFHASGLYTEEVVIPIVREVSNYVAAYY
jgi:hypothetical protein